MAAFTAFVTEFSAKMFFSNFTLIIAFNHPYNSILFTISQHLHLIIKTYPIYNTFLFTLGLYFMLCGLASFASFDYMLAAVLLNSLDLNFKN